MAGLGRQQHAAPPTVESGLVVFSDAGGTGGIDAIDEYSRRMVAALGDAGVLADYIPRGLGAVPAMARPPWLLLEYNPLSYGRWGFAPQLVAQLRRLRQRAGTRIVVAVHEPWVGVYGWRSALMHGYQRLQLAALLAQADAVVTMTEGLAARIGRGAVSIPVGTNITPVAIDRSTARASLGLEDRRVIALFGRAHPSRALDYAAAAINRLAASPEIGELTVLNLGDRAPRLSLGSVEVRTPGGQSPIEISRALRAADLLLLPFSDGLSTRRTTLMAGFAHSVAVAGLAAPDTDRSLLSPYALLLTPVGDPRRYAQAVCELVADEARLRSVGEAGHLLYEERFAWPVIARGMLEVLEGP